MKVALVAPSYPSATCGIATYSEYLTTELRKFAHVEVVGRQSERSSRHFLDAVADVAHRADVIHIQHAFDIFGYMGHLTSPLYRVLNRTRKPIVTTLHELPP